MPQDGVSCGTLFELKAAAKLFQFVVHVFEPFDTHFTVHSYGPKNNAEVDCVQPLRILFTGEAIDNPT